MINTPIVWIRNTPTFQKGTEWYGVRTGYESHVHRYTHRYGSDTSHMRDNDVWTSIPHLVAVIERPWLGTYEVTTPTQSSYDIGSFTSLKEAKEWVENSIR